MSGKTWYRAVLAGFVVCAMAAAGCSSDSDVKSDVDTVGGGDALTGDYPLDGRPDEGTRITEVKFENVLFKFDSAQIQESEVAKVQAVVDYMSKNAGVRLVAEGHCDERGSNEYNMSLGESRALAVRATAIRLGIDKDRIQTRSFGEEKPLDPRHVEDAWKLNRRAEFALYKK